MTSFKFAAISRSWLDILTVALAISIAYVVGLCVYRLYFSPLARFPGPKLAALTMWYEAWYDLKQRGRFSWEIESMHEKYGPIVRINPHEIHISDPDFYDTLYTPSSAKTQKRYKFPWSARMFANPSSVLSTIPHDMHHSRRAPLLPFFSTAAVTSLAPTVHEHIETLCSRLQNEYLGKGNEVWFDAAYMALTTDIITEYAFARPWGRLQGPDFSPDDVRTNKLASEVSVWNKHFDYVFDAFRNMPRVLARIMDPATQGFVDREKALRSDIIALKQSPEKAHQLSHRTMFHELLQSRSLPESEKTVDRLLDEARTVLGAGTLTTAHVLKDVTYHIIAAKDSILPRLLSELDEAMPDPTVIPPLPQLEKLPYLSAIVNEALRITVGVSGRLTRIIPNASLQYGSFIIPKGTPVSMSARIQHRDTRLYPEPDSFQPDRWLPADNPDVVKRLHGMVPFSRGGRNCIGMNLARLEIFATIAAVFRRFEMRLADGVTHDDVEIVHDFFVPLASLHSKGVRATIVGLRK